MAMWMPLIGDFEYPDIMSKFSIIGRVCGKALTIKTILFFNFSFGWVDVRQN